MCLSAAAAVWVPETANARANVFRVTENSHMGRLRITLHKSDTIEVDETFAEVLIGDPSIADVLPMTNHTIYILGKAVGSTNVSIYDKNKELIGVLDLEVAYDVGQVRRSIRESVPGASVKVTSGERPTAPERRRPGCALAHQGAQSGQPVRTRRGEQCAQRRLAAAGHARGAFRGSVAHRRP